MTGKIYLIRDGSTLLPMTEQPYNSEALLQKLLAEHPALLAGEQMTDSAPRRWLLICRELALRSEDGGAGFLDHLFVDQDGILTLVEVKRSGDTRIRREVVGQMLDYAANLVSRTSVEVLRTKAAAEPDAAVRIQEFLQGSDAEDLWSAVEVNLAAGRIRMVFVADVIPPELRTVVDFLAGQLRSAEIFAVEVRNYAGEGEQVLVPRLVSTPKADEKVSRGSQWDERTFFTELRRQGENREAVAQSVLEWARSAMPDFWYGKGATAGSCIPRLLLGDAKLLLFALWTYGSVEMQLQHMRVPPFDDEQKRCEMIERLNRIPGVAISKGASSRRPSFDMVLLESEAARRQFLDVMEWAINAVRAANTSRQESAQALL